MCGIWAFLSSCGSITPATEARLRSVFNTLTHRGPNASRFNIYNDVVCAFHRLAIVDVSMRGMAPFEYKDLVCIANAEIYNYMDLEEELKQRHHDSFKSTCDTEVILPLFDYLGRDIEALCKRLDGEFAFVIYDRTKNVAYFATDEISVRPIFVGLSDVGVILSSELIALTGLCTRVERLGAGQYGIVPNCSNPNVDSFAFKSYYNFHKQQIKISYEDAKNRIRELFIQNVKDKIHYGVRNDGFYLSGGLDSSLVAGIAAKLRAPKKLNTFTVGFSRDASDIIYARHVAEYIGSNHHEIIVSEDDGIAKLEEIIKFLGTFDQTTVRASTPLYLATEWIKQKYSDIYIMYNGELADELQAGYLYFRNAPNSASLHEESIRRLAAVHNFDGLRCDRVCSAFSIEARFPFFSKSLLNFVLSLPPEYLDPKSFNGTEKYLIRDAFRNTGYIPEEILWRTKNALSDATSVKSSWKDKLKAHVAKLVTDEQLVNSSERWKHVTPDTKEDVYYRMIFDKYYAGFENTIPYKWLPLWCGKVTDSSASVLSVFNEDSIGLKKAQL
eukprot:TRINITY_DN4699_c1_g1_i1.p1 TRINITY_DN4699_c1_g1~~TRINITY_DN4699_c1_g1_i1.p1  ORF type:complete len:556 (+),score=100.02 TRINITY_DN4699_c1_g1_i1:74-1741(+)